MADTHPFRTAADVADANVTDGGITETFLDAMKKRTALALGPTESLSSFDFSVGSPPFAVIYGATGYVYFYNPDDTTSPDDGLTVLLSADSRRYILADSSAIAVSSVLAIDNEPPASPVDGDAYVVDTAPTGAWVGHAKDIALRTPRGWVFAQPQVGATLLNQETGFNIQYSAAGSWGALSPSIPDATITPESMLMFGGLSVEAQQNAPPGSPAVGEYYLVGLSPSGDWVGHENDIAYYTSTSVWAFLAAYDGAMVFNKASDTSLQWFDATGDWRAPWPYQAVCQGRLTLESGEPISIVDKTAKGTLYFTPFRGNNIALYVNGGWALRTFTEKSLSLTGYTSGKPFDIFGYDNAGVLALESLVWTDDTTRATALTLQDGILVKSGDATRRYLGTIYTSATGQCEDSVSKRFVWNAANRVKRKMYRAESADSWTYVLTSWRQAFNSTANQLDYVQGLAEDEVEATLVAFGAFGGATVYVGIGVDSIIQPTPGFVSFQSASGSGVSVATLMAKWSGHPGVGRHTLKWLERGGSGVTFYGDVGGDSVQSGIIGSIWG